MALNADQIERYSRQILIPEVGGRGQNRLLACRARCVGRSATLSTAVDYLAAAGVQISLEPAAEPTSADVVLATVDEGVHAYCELPVFLTGEDDATAWYSRRTGADTCRACLHVAAGEAAEGRDVSSGSAAVAGAALAVDAIAQLLGLATDDVPSVVVFSHGGRLRRCLPIVAQSCDHRHRIDAGDATKPVTAHRGRR